MAIALVLASTVLAGPSSAAPSDLGPFSSAEVLVRRQFADFLGRSPFAVELSTQVGRLEAGTADAPTVIDDIARTTGGADRTGSITRLYLAYFLRNPDASGLGYWVGKARNGTTLQRISSGFAGSSEFKNRYGALTNAAFVTLVYQNVLGRTGDSSGIAYWTKQLDLRRKDRGQVMLGFSESSEYARKTAAIVDVVVVEAAMAQRIPTGQAWTDALALVTAEGRLALIRQVFASDAYRTRFPVPAAPASIGVDADDAQLLVRWGAAPAAAPAIDGYEVRATPASGTPTLAVVGPTVRSTVLRGLANGTAYTVTVRARNANGLGAPATSGPWTPEVPSRWTAYQGGGLHDGTQRVDPPPVSPVQRWSVDLGDEVSYPVVANGRAFVTVRSSGTGDYGGRLYAFDLDTGATLWGPIELGGDYFKQALAWDRGVVYTVNGDGLVRAHRDTDGAVLWSRQLSTSASRGLPPVARDGVVYVVNDGSNLVHAIDGTTGAIRWSASAPDGQITPIVTADTVYVNSSCKAKAFDLDGTVRWTSPGPCDDGFGAASTLAGSRLYVRGAWGDGQAIISTSGAKLAGTFPGVLVPAISGSTGVGVADDVVTAFDPVTLATRWTATLPAPAALAPVIAGGRAYVATSYGVIVAYDLATGAVVWSKDAGVLIASVDEWNASGPLTGMAVADGHLLVPVNDRLVAFG